MTSLFRPHYFLVATLILNVTAFATAIFPTAIRNKTSVPVIITTIRVVQTAGASPRTTRTEASVIIQPGEQGEVMLMSGTHLMSAGYTTQITIAQATVDGQRASKPVSPPLVITDFDRYSWQRGVQYGIEIDSRTGKFALMQNRQSSPR